jgi:hypothetical protein
MAVAMIPMPHARWPGRTDGDGDAPNGPCAQAELSDH